MDSSEFKTVEKTTKNMSTCFPKSHDNILKEAVQSHDHQHDDGTWILKFKVKFIKIVGYEYEFLYHTILIFFLLTKSGTRA